MMTAVRLHRVKRLLVGSPLPTAQQRHERLGKATGLAIFASDPLSSNAYATEEIVRVLILAGPIALSYSLPIAAAIVTIVLPEFIPARWWQHLLHNQTALVVKGAMLFRKNVIVTDVPYHLRH
jgi:hypothetical protein